MTDVESSAPERSTSMSRQRRLLERAAVFVPVLVQALIVIREFSQWKPVWAWYADPGYQYLLAGASLISGGSPALVYHPGTSFQWFTGIVERLAFVFVGDGSFFTSVVGDPESYTRAVGSVVAVIFIGSLAFAAWRMVNLMGVWPSLVFQLLILWGLPVIANARYQLWPESLVLSCAVIVIALLVPSLLPRPSSPSLRLVITLGVVCALGLTAKILFVPIILMCLVVLPVRRWVAYLSAVVVMTLVVLLPIHDRWPDMWQWFANISTKPGRHGGAGDWSPIHNFVEGNLALAGYYRWYVPIAVLLVAATAVVAFLQARRDAISVRPTVAVILAVTLVVAVTAKQSEVRDLVLVVPLLALLAAHLVQRGQSLPIPPRASLAVGVAATTVASFLALHGIVHHANFDKEEQRSIASIVDDARLVDSLDATGSWAQGYNVWTVQNAIMFGSNDALMLRLETADDLVNAEVRQKYPNALYFDLWSRTFQTIDEESKLRVLACGELQDRLARGPLGFVVESAGHVSIDPDSAEILLAGGSATFDGPTPVGRYFSYRLTNISCDQ